MKRTLSCTLALVTIIGCSSASRSPDAIRQDTAAATATATKDAKALAEGVFDGLKEKGPLNINRATEDQLEALPGINAVAAHRIIAGRPFSDSRDLLKRRLVSKAEFDRIAGKIEAK